MFKNNKPRIRESLHKDKRIAIEDYILDYVKRNPGKSIPSSKIGAMAETPAYNVSTVIKQLVRLGEIRKVSRYTYEINERPTAPPPVQSALPPQPAPENIAFQVEVLAKDYVWQSDEPSLKGFIRWLKND